MFLFKKLYHLYNMKKTTILLALIISGFIAKGQYPSFVWAKIATSIGADNFSDVALDQVGNVYVVGKFDEDIIIGTDTFYIPSSGNSDALFVKYDANGNYLWGQQLGGTGPQDAYHIVISELDEIFICGRIAGTSYMGTTSGVPQFLNSSGNIRGYLSKFDTNGELIWTNLVDGTSYTWPFSLAIDNNNDVMMTGSFVETANFGNGVTTTSFHQLDLFVAKYSKNGTCLWAFSEGGYNADWAYDIAVDGNGNFAIAGSFDDTLNLSGNTLIAKGNGDAIVAFYDSLGVLQWFDHTGGYSTQTVTSDAASKLIFDLNDNLWVTGYYQDTMIFNTDTLISLGYEDIYMVQYDGSGNVFQTKSLGGSALHDQPSDIAIDNVNNILLAASAYYFFTVDDSSYYTYGMNDIAVMQFSPTGQLNWFKHGGTPYNDFASGIAVNNIGEVYLTGGVGDKSPVIFDTITLTPTGTEQWYEAIVAKLSWIPLFPEEINELSINEITNFPNPATNSIYIEGKEMTTLLKIYSLNGTELYSNQIKIPEKIDVTNFSAGFYIFNFPEQNRSFKVAIQK